MKRVLQVNLENSGGAFQLIYQVQTVLKDEIQFDYYSMGLFKKDDVYYDLLSMGSNIYEGNLRDNRLLGHIKLPFKFYKFIKKNNYDIVHINSDSAWKISLYSIPAKLAKVKKIIIHSHSSEINGDHIKFKKICHRIAKQFIKISGTDFLGCSKESVEWMYKNNLKDKNVKIINNGVNAEKFKFNRDIRKFERDKIKVDKECLIGTVGNFSYQKNPEFLIKLMLHLKKRKDEVYKLIFVGEGEDRKKIENLVIENSLTNDVIFYGKTDKVNEVLNAFDIFIMPSRFEGLPVSGIEAQTNGLPCIFSENITKEVKISDECKYLSLDDSLEIWCDTISNMKFNKNRGKAYENTINKNFDINYTANQLKELYYF